MKKLLIIFALLFTCLFWVYSQTYSAVNNLNIGSLQNQGSQVTNNEKLKEFGNGGQFITVTKGGEKGIFNTLIKFARDLKNLFYAIATIYFLVIALRLILASNTEEEVGKFKKGIIWITIWLVMMQFAFSFTRILFDRGVGETLAFSLMQNLIEPIINLMMTLAALFFLAMAIFAFYSLVTANGNEENIKKGKMTIFYAIIGFMLIRFARWIVEAVYGKIDCNNLDLWIITIEWGNCINRANLSGGVDVVVTIINWMNGFVGIVVVIMIMYAGIQILLSAGDEEKLKKWKQALIYIAIGLAILVMNYLILTFFLLPRVAI